MLCVALLPLQEVIYTHERYTTSGVFQERVVVEIDRSAIAGFNFKQCVLRYATSAARGTRAAAAAAAREYGSETRPDTHGRVGRVSTGGR